MKFFLFCFSTDENARTKAHFAQEAARVGLAVVFPDTSPRGVNIEGQVRFPPNDNLLGNFLLQSRVNPIKSV